MLFAALLFLITSCGAPSTQNQGAATNAKPRPSAKPGVVPTDAVADAGDTACTDEMRALKNIDIAFIPMNLPYTMPHSEAAECVKAFRPKVVYPYHYRGQNPEKFKAALKDVPVEVRLLEWYPTKTGGTAKQ